MSARYIAKVASATEQGIGLGLYLYFALDIVKREPEEFAYSLAGAATNYLLLRTANNPEQIEFGRQHKDRAQREALNLWRGADKCELLSGAVYNISYGRYVRAGGGVLFNHFLAFIKAESKMGPLPYQKLNAISPSILELILHLKQLRLWVPRGSNPNELAYFNAVKNFTENQRQIATRPKEIRTDSLQAMVQAERAQATQMFDPPIAGRTMIAGCPVLRIPNSEKKYPNFLAWWNAVGRLKPREAQGWSTLSGPGVMWDRVEIINPSDWAALPEEERELIASWVRTWPIGMFFD